MSHDAVHSAVAAKADLEDVCAENRSVAASTTADFAAVRAEMTSEFGAVHAEIGTVRSEMREQRSELKLWTAGAALAVVGGLVPLMPILLRARGIG